MRIQVKVKPKAKNNKVEKASDNKLTVRVTEAPEKGKANQAVTRLLADYFKVPRSSITLVMGEHASVKVFEVK